MGLPGTVVWVFSSQADKLARL